jgi:glyoxylase-like metal-dependent hydrolase (beta-lactamase superfamily II)
MDGSPKSTATVDLEFRSRSRYLASCVLVCGPEVAILDPGPASTLDVLQRKLHEMGIRFSDISTVLLTHIHLDHAGATGTLVEKNPNVRVLVHERGAKHLADPTQLLKSVSRVFGASGEEFWGPIKPVPLQNLKTLAGGEQILVGTREFEVLYTPGHAKHHVSYFERGSEIAFVGDALGIRTNNAFVYPATPPPDIDLQQLYESADLLESRDPKRLFLTHFGLMEEVKWHFADFRDRLGRWAEFVRQSLLQPVDDERRAKLFSEMAGAEAASLISESEAQWFTKSVSSSQNWYGLARYWRRLEASGATDKGDKK